MKALKQLLAILTILCSLLNTAESSLTRRESLFLRLKRYKRTISHFGHEVYHLAENNLAHTVLEWTNQPVFSNEQQLRDFHKEFLTRNRTSFKDTLAKCTANAKHDKVNYFQFLASKSAVLDPNTRTASFQPRCFNKNVTVSYTKKDNSTIELEFITAGHRNSIICMDYYLISAGLHHHIELLYLKGKHKVTMKNIAPEHMAIVEAQGIQIFGFCDGLLWFLPNLLKTLKLFLGGLGLHKGVPLFNPHPPKWMENANVDFIKEATGFQWKPRQNGEVLVNLNESDIHDGDFLAVTRFDGLDQFIEYVTGSHSGHSTVAMRINGDLHIIESQDGWYWPKRHIQRTPYSLWIKQAQDAGMHVALVPLRAEVRQQFNTEKALEWFYSVEGQPYGYHNFLFGALDTKEDNVQGLFDTDFLLSAVPLLEALIPGAVESLFGQAMNKRLGTVGLNYQQIWDEVVRRNTTIKDVWTWPERDGWVYNDGVSYVCSSFVIGLYKAGGLFGNLSIQATEFTPRDLYMINFFDKNATLPDICKQTDPDLPYCQIMGRFKMELPEYSTVDPYDHMNENCPTLPPNYTRPAGC